MKSEFQDQVVLITGSSQGIGKSLAIDMGLRGAKIGINGRNMDKLLECHTELNEMGITNFMVPGDVTDYETCEKIISKMIAEFGRLDSVVANASMMVEASLLEIKPEVFRTAIDSQVLGAVYPIKAALKALIDSKGYILLISSLAALYGLPRFTAYSMGKAAHTKLAESLRIELLNTGVDIGVAYVCFTKNEPDKKMYLPNGELSNLPKRPTRMQQPREKVARDLAKMIKKKTRSKTLSFYGKAFAFSTRYLPNLVKIFIKKKLPI